jgi:hypothetical protein
VQHSGVADVVAAKSLHLLPYYFAQRRFNLDGWPVLLRCFVGCTALQGCITSKHFAAARSGCAVSSGSNCPLFLRGLKQKIR